MLRGVRGTRFRLLGVHMSNSNLLPPNKSLNPTPKPLRGLGSLRASRSGAG